MTMLLSERAKKSVLEEFDKFRSRIEPTVNEINSISTSHTRIRSLLRNSTKVNVIDSFLTGSYARQTMIRPLTDVDFFIQIHYGKHKNDTSIQLLNKVRQVLRSAYFSTPIAISPPCIRVKFSYCHFEIVPAIAIKGSSGLFEIPVEKRVGWQSTHPKVPDEWMTQENKKAGGLFKPTIKILKRWRDVRKIPLRSFHLEMLVAMTFEQYQINDYAEGILAFFGNSNNLFEQNKWLPFVKEPANVGGYVDQYLYDNIAQLSVVKNRIKQYFNYAQRAFDYMNKGNSGTAKALWRNIFGNSFYASSTSTMPPQFLSLLASQPKPVLPPSLFRGFIDRAGR